MLHESDVALLRGDCMKKLREFGDASIDAVVTDPPYELRLIGLAWDSTSVTFSVELWREVIRVLKPGGHLLAFGGTRTYHRMTTAIEDAGFEIRDSIHWIYGSGFPKSLDVSKSIDRRRDDTDAVRALTRFVRAARDRAGRTNADIDALFGTKGMASHWTTTGSQPVLPTAEQWKRLKAYLAFGDEMDGEFARLSTRKGKPGDAWQQRTVTGHYKKASPGRLWKEQLDGNGSRRAAREHRNESSTAEGRQWQGWGTTVKPGHEPIVLARKPMAGRVAPNVLQFRTGALNIDACRLGERPTREGASLRRWPTNVIFDADAARELDAQGKKEVSRFFYVVKPTTSERDAGLADIHSEEGAATSVRGRRNLHRTVKPIALMRYLVRLVTPPGGVVLDPFAGSGTTGIAAVLEGARFIGIERDKEFAAIAEARISHWKGAADVERAAA